MKIHHDLHAVAGGTPGQGEVGLQVVAAAEVTLPRGVVRVDPQPQPDQVDPVPGSDLKEVALLPIMVEASAAGLHLGQAGDVDTADVQGRESFGGVTGRHGVTGNVVHGCHPFSPPTVSPEMR